MNVGARDLTAVVAAEGAAERSHQVELLLGAGHADVAEAALLLQLRRVAALQGAHVRQQPLLQPDDEDDRELQPLRRVEGDEGRGIHGVIVLVDVGDEGGVLQERGQGVLRLQLVVLGGDGAQLLHVLPALLAVGQPLALLPEQVLAVARALDDRVQKLGEGSRLR